MHFLMFFVFWVFFWGEFGILGGKSPQEIAGNNTGPSLALPLIPFHCHSYSYPHRLFHPMPCTSSSLSYTYTTIHRFLISPSFCSCKLGYMLFLELFDTVLMKSTKIHSPLQTLTHNLTPPSLHVKLPPKTPSSPLYPNSIPIYPILYTFL